MAELTDADIRETVRERYANAAKAAATGAYEQAEAFESGPDAAASDCVGLWPSAMHRRVRREPV